MQNIYSDAFPSSSVLIRDSNKPHVLHVLELKTLMAEVLPQAINRLVPCGDMDRKLKVNDCQGGVRI